MKQYLDLIRNIRNNGSDKTDRTGTGTRSIFGHPQLRFHLSEGFPLVTTKKVHLKSIIHELLWKLSGDTNIKYLTDNGVTIWDEWADENGDVGRVYGHQMRNFGWVPQYDSPQGLHLEQPGFDQVTWLEKTIKENPDSRRLIMSLWNANDVPHQKLPPCPCFYHFEVHDGKLNLLMYQRSCDTFLGVPFNIAQESLLLMMMAQVTGYEAGEYIHTFGDAHIYNNHFDQVDLQLKREPFPLPTIKLNPDVKSILDFKYEDFLLTGYQHHERIKGTVAV